MVDQGLSGNVETGVSSSLRDSMIKMILRGCVFGYMFELLWY